MAKRKTHIVEGLGKLVPTQYGAVGWHVYLLTWRPEHEHVPYDRPRPRAFVRTKAEGIAWLEAYQAGSVDRVPHPTGRGGQWRVKDDAS